MYEKIESELENHYANTNSKFENIIAFEKKLLKLCDNNNADSLNLILEKLLTNVSNQYNLTLDVSTKIDNIIYGEPQEIIEEPYDYEDYKLSEQKNKKIRIVENAVTNLEDSKKEFTSNFQFNVILIYIISMEIIIKLIYDLIKNIREYPINKNYQDKLKKLLFASIRNYIQAVTFYKENFLKFNLDYIKLDFPHDDLSTLPKDINEKDFISINLLFSAIKIDYNTLITNKKNIKDKPILKQKSKNNLDRNTFREYSTSVHNRKKNNNINITTLKRNFSTSLIRSNNLLKSMRDNKELNNVNNKNINYNKSIFSLLDHIKELTQDKIYNPKEVQLKIENFWFDLLKERYNENVYNSIKDIQPKIYEIFVTKDPNSLRFVSPELYLFLDDIKIYLITYSVITTYFRRSSRTAICSLVADQILFYVYQTYFYPIIKGGDKGVKNVKIKKSKSKKEYDKADIFNSLTKTKKDKLLKLIEVSKFKKADLIDNNKLNKKDNEQLISSIIFILEKF